MCKSSGENEEIPTCFYYEIQIDVFVSTAKARATNEHLQPDGGFF